MALFYTFNQNCVVFFIEIVEYETKRNLLRFPIL
ncbi:hypothetical protein Glo7428_3015 [Gloeocapsa sp. PCC 7428]|nr:hypothetical protein Glo7428_3015 [Gloeocapsa sp. PCC 7428]